MDDLFTISKDDIIKYSNYKLSDEHFKMPILSLIQYYPQILQYIKTQTPELCMEALKYYKLTLQFVKEQT